MDLETLTEYYARVKQTQNKIYQAIKEIQDINDKVGEHDKTQPQGLDQHGIDQLLLRLERNIKNILFADAIKKIKSIT